MAVGTYLAYLVISIVLTVWVAHTLSKNGLAFLRDSFAGNEELARSVNHLLVVGFYLLNLGFIALALKMSSQPENLQQSIEMLSYKVGRVLIVLGIMHLFNMYVIHRWRRAALDDRGRHQISHTVRPLTRDEDALL